MSDDPIAAIRKGLEALIAHHEPGARGVVIEGIARAGAGHSTENWLFDAGWVEEGTEVRRQLILRRTSENEIVLAKREDEFALLYALGRTTIPSPRAYWMDRDGGFLGRPAMVLERCAGAADRAILSDKNKAGLARDVRVALAREFARTLAAIHAVDFAGLELPAGWRRGGEDPARHEFALQEREWRRHEIDACLELRLAAWWLRDHLPPPPARRVLVHADYRPGNMLVDNGHLSAVLDWEMAHIGDPAEDLGWYLAACYRHEHFIEGAWSPADFLAAYEAAGGARPDPDAVRFWAVFALYKLAGIALATATAFVKGDAGHISWMPKGLLVPLMAAIGEADGGMR